MNHPTLQELTESVHGLSPASDHPASCPECRDMVARLGGELELLRRADARLAPEVPRRRLGSIIPLAFAAAILLGVTAFVVFRAEPDPAPGTGSARQDKVDASKTIDAFLDGKEEDSAQARRLLVERGPEVLGALVEARFHRAASIRPDALAALILELKEKRAGETGAPLFRKLKTVRVTADIQNSPLTAVMAYFGEITGLNLSIDPALKPEEVFVSLKVMDVPLNRALDLLGFVTPIEYDVRYGTLFIAAPGRLFKSRADAPIPLAALFRRQELSPEGKTALKKMNEMKMDLAFENSLLSDVVAFIRDATGLNIVLQSGVGQESITFKAKEQSISSVLELVTLPRELDARLEGETLLIFKPK